MKRNMLPGLVGSILLLCVGIAVLGFSYQQKEFNGSRVKSAYAYLLDIKRMNGTDLHTLELQKADVLNVRFETEKGSMYMEIKAPDGTSVYRGNGRESTDFTVNIPESGVYAVVVEAHQARGAIHIQLAGGRQ